MTAAVSHCLPSWRGLILTCSRAFKPRDPPCPRRQRASWLLQQSPGELHVVADSPVSILSSSKSAYPFGFALNFLIRWCQFLPSTWKTKLKEVFLLSGAASVLRSLAAGRPFLKSLTFASTGGWSDSRVFPAWHLSERTCGSPRAWCEPAAVALPLVIAARCCGSAVSADKPCSVSSPGICCEVIWHLRLQQVQHYSVCSFQQGDAVVVWLTRQHTDAAWPLAALLPEYLQVRIALIYFLFFFFFS